MSLRRPNTSRTAQLSTQTTQCTIPLVKRRKRTQIPITFGPKDHEIIAAPPPPVLEVDEQMQQSTSKRGKKRIREGHESDSNDPRAKKRKCIVNSNDMILPILPPQSLIDTVVDNINKSWKCAVNDIIKENGQLKQRIKTMENVQSKCNQQKQDLIMNLDKLRINIKEFEQEKNKNKNELNGKQEKVKMLQDDAKVNANRMNDLQKDNESLMQTVECKERENKTYRRWKEILTQFQQQEEQQEQQQQEHKEYKHDDDDLQQRIKENEESEHQIKQWIKQTKKVQHKYKAMKKLLKDKREENKKIRKERDTVLRKQIEFEKKINEYKKRIIKTDQKLLELKEREIGYKNEIDDLNECVIIAEFKSNGVKQENADDEDGSVDDEDDSVDLDKNYN